MPKANLHAIPAAAFLVASVACHRQPALVQVLEPVPVTLEQSIAELSPQEAAALAPRVTRLLVMPDSVTIAPGESYSYAQLRVIIVDSSGSALGRLRVFDTSLDPGAAALTGRQELRGVYPGRGELWIRFPQALWSGGASAPPAVAVHVLVQPPAPDARRAPSPNDH